MRRDRLKDEDRPPVLAHCRFAAERESFAGLGLRQRFERIYATNLWGARESRSGLGSEVGAAARVVRELPRLIERLGVRSLLDASCGDAGWINQAQLDVAYTGVDIVSELVADLNRRAARGEVRGRYLELDITIDDLPSADAVLCRDCLVHLSFANIVRAVENVRRSGARFLIATTFPELCVNHDCEDGDWRALNFERPPFAWPPPITLLDENCSEAGGGYRDKSLGVWRCSEIPRGCDEQPDDG